MITKKHTLSKEERLSWKRYIDQLFAEGESFIAFPLRVVFFSTEAEAPVRSSILVSIPKKRVKRAVKRVRIRRLVKETYRVRKHELIDTLEAKNKNMRIAFLYLGKEDPTFQEMEKGMNKAIRLLCEKG